MKICTSVGVYGTKTTIYHIIMRLFTIHLPIIVVYIPQEKHLNTPSKISINKAIIDYDWCRQPGRSCCDAVRRNSSQQCNWALNRPWRPFYANQIVHQIGYLAPPVHILWITPWPHHDLTIIKPVIQVMRLLKW